MKKLVFFIALSLLVLSACSDDESSEVKISFNESQLQSIDGVDTGKYFKSIDHSSNQVRFIVYLPYPDNKESTYACNAICPNTEYNHRDDIYIRIDTETEEYYCPQCGARFNISNGAPLNDAAKDHQLQIYKLFYNSKTKNFHIQQ